MKPTLLLITHVMGAVLAAQSPLPRACEAFGPRCLYVSPVAAAEVTSILIPK
jgi:hypothetical protein